MKFIKNITYIILAVVLLGSQVVIPDFIEEAQAESLKDLRAELATLEKEYNDKQHEKEVTEAEIAAAKKEVDRISIEQEEIEQEIKDITAEMETLKQQIEDKNEQIKEIIAYYQLSATGSDAYLEYVFTATDFTDFIYRMAIAEQLSDYNDKLISDYEDLILQNEKKKEELSNKTIELDNMTKELEKKMKELRVELKETMEGALSVEEEIQVLKDTIKQREKTYEAYKCEETLEYKACLAKAPQNELPVGTAFFRPVVSGRISSNYGYRSFTLNGKPYSDFHYGLDFATSHGSTVYSIANGRVVATINAKSIYDNDKKKKKICGGNKVYIVHTINGKDYTSAYYHLATINVKVGEIVTYDTKIGTVGGSPGIEYWDNCSTGSHVHLQMGKGHYLTDYYTYSGFVSHRMNPREVVNAPALGGSFSDRKRKY